MKENSMKKYGLIMLAIGVIFVVFIFSSKIVRLIKNKNNETNTVQQSFRVNENADYMTPINRYFQGISEKNPGKVLDAFPTIIGIDQPTMNNQIQNLYASYETRCGKNVKIECEYNSGIKLSEDQVNQYETAVNKQYSSNIDITEMYEILIYINATGDTSQVRDSLNLRVGKINNTWYLV